MRVQHVAEGLPQRTVASMGLSVRSRAMATFDVIRRGGDLPPWWNLGTVAIGAVVFIAFSWSLLSDFVNPPGDVKPTVDPPAASSTPDVGIPDDPDADTDASTPDPTTPSGDGQPSANGATLQVPTTSGTKVKIPVAAFSVAKDALEGLYDPAKAADVPVADGAEFPAPETSNSAVTFTALQVSRASDAAVTFVGVADPDGAGVQPQTFHTIAVTLDSSGWVWTPSGG